MFIWNEIYRVTVKQSLKKGTLPSMQSCWTGHGFGAGRVVAKYCRVGSGGGIYWCTNADICCCCLFIFGKMIVNSTAEHESVLETRSTCYSLVALCSLVTKFTASVLVASFLFPFPPPFTLHVFFSNLTEISRKCFCVNNFWYLHISGVYLLP